MPTDGTGINGYKACYEEAEQTPETPFVSAPHLLANRKLLHVVDAGDQKKHRCQRRENTRLGHGGARLARSPFEDGAQLLEDGNDCGQVSDGHSQDVTEGWWRTPK